jgi:hypothetical protein
VVGLSTDATVVSDVQTGMAVPGITICIRDEECVYMQHDNSGPI